MEEISKGIVDLIMSEVSDFTNIDDNVLHKAQLRAIIKTFVDYLVLKVTQPLGEVNGSETTG